MEHIPIKYELVAFKPDRLRSVKSNEVWLEEPLDQKNYTYWNELYFGRGQNVATGSRVVLHMGNGTKIPLQWGIPQRLPQTTQLTFENQKG